MLPVQWVDVHPNMIKSSHPNLGLNVLHGKYGGNKKMEDAELHETE